jgi:hypothetical protein
VLSCWSAVAECVASGGGGAMRDGVDRPLQGPACGRCWSADADEKLPLSGSGVGPAKRARAPAASTGEAMAVSRRLMAAARW